jgi:hypothetical protein
MDDAQTKHVLTAGFLRAASRILLWVIVAIALAAVLDHHAKGEWWDQSYWLSMLIPVTVMPLSIWVLFVPREIEWSHDGCVIRTRVRGPLAFAWEQLIGFGKGRGCFLIQFAGAPRFAIYSGAYDQSQWQEFKRFLQRYYPEKEAGLWTRPPGFR